MIQLNGGETVTALRARYVFPVDAPPIDGGVVSFRGERIVAVGENLSGAPPIDLGNVAILPGLVNAHTHLEFSNLTAPLGPPGQSLPNWIRRVITRRSGDTENKSAAILSGLQQSIALGTSTLGEISTGGSPPTEQFDGDVTAFFEVLALSPNAFYHRIVAAVAWAQGLQARAIRTKIPDQITPGISPHAPYSVPWRELPLMFKRASFRHGPVATHVAESQEELELLRSHGGPFRELFEQIGVWNPSAFPVGSRAFDYLQRMQRITSDIGRCLVIHGNYLEDDEIWLLAQHSQQMSLVYCPRTHYYFRHEHYPLAAFLAAGVHMAFGTDSRASNPDLSLLGEMRHAARHHRDVSPETILRIGTLGGAQALNVADQSGSLLPGKLANLVVLPLPEGQRDDPHELLFESEQAVTATIWRGQQVAGEPLTGGNS